MTEQPTKSADVRTAVRWCFEEVLSDAKKGEAVLLRVEKEVYRGYLDDYRNTDNAWIETTTFNYHLKDDKNCDEIEPKVSSHARSIMMLKSM